MRKHLLFTLLVIISVLFVLADCFAVPECISNLCLRGRLSSLPTEGQVKKLIGSARKSKPSIPHRKSSCHIISTPKHKEVFANFTYINIGSKWRLISITVASKRLCDDPEPLSVNYEFLTEKGIGLGSRKDDIVAAYGKPAYLIKSPSRDLVVSYFPDATKRDAYAIVQYVSDVGDLLTTRFFLLKDMVVGIDLSADE